MQPVSMAELTSATIMFLAGLFATLYGFRWIGKKPGNDPVYDARTASTRRLFRLLGPLLMLGAPVLFIMKTSTSSTLPQWRTVTTSDGVCSIDMPGEPLEGEGPEVKGMPREMEQRISQEGGAVQYSLGHSAIALEYRKLPPEELLKDIGENWLRVARQMGKTQVIDEHELSENGWPGREIVIDIDSQRMQQRWVIVNQRLYRAIVSTPRESHQLANARRFLDSFRILKKPDADKGS